MPKPLATASPVQPGTDAIPNGSPTRSATAMARASPSRRSKRRPAWPLAMMYAAQQVPASAASPSPAHSSWASGVRAASEMRTTPTAAAPTAARSRARRDSTVARVSGPRNSMVTATPMGRWASEA